ncbi:hypothetical protein BDDG_00848 [Blastomyces dermatitidis ATCC 18188]|uniref:Uncharacterized protein n=1 Tax=Ajellomyces dermatitidis (strain ATCC 18188 / CBS 674.68) TaxID=653446 RepID=F2T3A9_AJEDA|nr:hypothetical protein BDDG_00848 [Blastomyces dermatitidis ATCC 18188]
MYHGSRRRRFGEGSPRGPTQAAHWRIMAMATLPPIYDIPTIEPPPPYQQFERIPEAAPGTHEASSSRRRGMCGTGLDSSQRTTVDDYDDEDYSVTVSRMGESPVGGRARRTAGDHRPEGNEILIIPLQDQPWNLLVLFPVIIAVHLVRKGRRYY